MVSALPSKNQEAPPFFQAFLLKQQNFTSVKKTGVNDQKEHVSETGFQYKSYSLGHCIQSGIIGFRVVQSGKYNDI